MATAAEASLARVVDDHLAWLVHWHHLAFFVTSARAETAHALVPPASFAAWFKGPAQELPQEQPIIDRLAILHDQLHTLARLTLLKAPEGQPLSESDYRAVMAKYQGFMNGVRQLEKAFAVAASGLDLLTGLRSRVGLADDILREQVRMKRGGKPFCLALIDLDHFKQVNDTYGHDGGDTVLAGAANIITRTIRAYDDAYRLGGEEFLVVFKENTLDEAKLATERLRAALQATPLPVPGRPPVFITASFGLIMANASADIDDLLKETDKALYKAKEDGRNCVRF
ncbi:MAG: diguanylate cyclase [Alphaproteobacteria bacterium]|nr:diguanylate cyclase [Alphaproteobacteria bacterium]